MKDNPFAKKISLKLDEMHPELSDKLLNTRLYSATSHIEVIHRIDNGTLHFLFPTIDKLWSDLEGVPFHYTYVESDNTDYNEDYCFYHLGNCKRIGGDNCTPNGIRNTFSGPCSLHPFIFEGETVIGKKFKVELLIGDTRNRRSFSGCYDDVPCNAHLSLNMRPYRILAFNNPLKIRVTPKPLNFGDNGYYDAKFGVTEELYIKSFWEYDNKTGEIVMTDEGIEFFMLQGALPGYGYINAYLVGSYLTKDKDKKYGFAHFFNFFIGVCTIKNKNKTKQTKQAGDFIVLRCRENELSFLQAADNGTFKFENIPQDCVAEVKLVSLSEREDIDLPFDMECRNYIEELLGNE
jgi:hypothetical protein